MEIGYLVCAIWLIICLVDLYDHNRKVEKMFPDSADPSQNASRRELTVSFYGFGFLIIMLIVFFIRSL